MYNCHACEVDKSAERAALCCASVESHHSEFEPQGWCMTATYCPSVACPPRCRIHGRSRYATPAKTKVSGGSTTDVSSTSRRSAGQRFTCKASTGAARRTVCSFIGAAVHVHRRSGHSQNVTSRCLFRLQPRAQSFLQGVRDTGQACVIHWHGHDLLKGRNSRCTAAATPERRLY